MIERNYVRQEKEKTARTLKFIPGRLAIGGGAMSRRPRERALSFLEDQEEAVRPSSG